MDHAKQEFVEKIGTYFESQGLALSAGRVAGLMMISERPYSLDEIAETLKISKASASLATRLLESAGMIERMTVRGDRRIHFRFLGEGLATNMHKKIQTIVYLADLAHEGQTVVTKGSEAEKRLAEMEAFYRYLADGFAQLVEQWNSRKKAREERENERK